jgi:hypothetical protein
MLLLTVLTALIGPVRTSPFPPPNIQGRTICARAYVQGVGWQSWRCASRGGALYVGTTGRRLPLQALSVWTSGTGGVCLAGAGPGTGWSRTRCVGEHGEVTVGTAGRGRLEAVRVSTHTGVCTNGHVQNLGWQAWRCGSAHHAVIGGVSGQGRRLEALRLSV